MRELVSISLWDGTIRERCTIAKQKLYLKDGEIIRTAHSTKQVDTKCNLINLTNTPKISYKQPLNNLFGRELDTLSFKYTEHGALVIGRDFKSEPFLSREYLLTRIKNITHLESELVPWGYRPYANPDGSYNYYEASAENCRIFNNVDTLRQEQWYFINLRCGYTDRDVNAINIFIPVSEKTMLKALGVQNYLSE